MFWWNCFWQFIYVLVYSLALSSPSHCKFPPRQKFTLLLAIITGSNYSHPVVTLYLIVVLKLPFISLSEVSICVINVSSIVYCNWWPLPSINLHLIQNPFDSFTIFVHWYIFMVWNHHSSSYYCDVCLHLVVRVNSIYSQSIRHSYGSRSVTYVILFDIVDILHGLLM